MSDVSYRAMKIGSWQWSDHESAMYRVACECGSPEHDFILSFDRDMADITLEIYADLSVLNPYWSEFTVRGFFRNHWWRLATAVKLLFGVYPESQTSLIVGDVDHLDSLIAALNEGRGMMTEPLDIEESK